MLSLDYIAGAIDCDGSISIAISENRYKSKKGKSQAQFAFVVNFRQVPQYIYILREIQETLNAGKVYEHNATSSTATAMASWQTTTHEEALRVCKMLQPHLKIKQKEATLMIEALEIWINNKGDRKGAGYSRPDWVKNKVKEIASLMNPSQQKSTSRRNKEMREIILPPPDLELMDDVYIGTGLF